MKHYTHPVIEQEDIDAVTRVLQSGVLSGYRANESYHLGGREVQAFEREFREYHSVKYAIAFNSATSALHVALIACGIGSDDEVITTPLTFSASASCIKMVGADIVFADIEEDTFNIDNDDVWALITNKTKAVIPVHLMGHPSGVVNPGNIFGIKVIEDACQSLGAEYHGKKVGTFGDCGVFSFNQSKPIATGEGGMLITNDDKIAEIARAVRNHGEVSTDLEYLGYNFRMGEMEAAIGRVQFSKLDERNQVRIHLANHLSEALMDIEGLTPPVTRPDCTHVYYTYGVKVDENKIGMTKHELQKRLYDKGVFFGLGDYKPLHLFPFYSGHEGQFPVAERISKEMMFTDILKYPMTIEDVDEMIGVIKKVLND